MGLAVKGARIDYWHFENGEHCKQPAKSSDARREIGAKGLAGLPDLKAHRAHGIGRLTAAGSLVRGSFAPRPESIDINAVLDTPGTPACLSPGSNAIKVGT